MYFFSSQQASSSSAKFAGQGASIFRIANVNRAVQVARNFADGSRRPK